jgi:L-ribulokinase
MPRSVCAAGHKGLFNPDWGGLPSKDFLKALDPRLADLRDRLYAKAHPSDHVAGTLKPEIAAKLGLRPETIVAVGAFDAHMGAVGSGVKPGVLVKIMGTSTCDCMVAPMPADGKLPLIPGVCGVVNGSVLPGMLGIEAGQSAVGDLFNWFVRYLCPASYEKSDAHVALSAEAIKLKPGESGLLALDWNNGNRTILVDQRLTGLLIGQTLQTSAPEIYRALIEATAFGALTIIRRMEEYGACVDEVVNCGGIAEKSALTMQIYADVCNRPMKISRSAQTCALGAALFAGVAAGAHKSVSEAQAAMTGVKEQVYSPDPKAAAVYAKLYQLYMKLHDGFCGVSHNTDLSGVMKELLAIKDAAAS